jgi:phosphopantothenoylcysteine decarboxylase/phosphopantothenate--cysteine ligase
MNKNMYRNRLVQENIKKLKKLKFRFIGPVRGPLASGEKGEGRLAGIEEIVKEVEKILRPQTQSLKGKIFLITAGPTQEPLDPLRYISNYSSGKMGYALASISRDRGAEVILVSGPTSLPAPEGVKTVRVKTALEMRKAVLKFFKKADVVIKSAAVVDYRAKRKSEKKIKAGENLKIELLRNPDILKELGKQKEKKILVGFSLETEDLIVRARAKLKEKNLDLIVANDISAFGSETTQASIITKEGKTIKLPRLSKEEVAEKIIDYIETRIVG